MEGKDPETAVSFLARMLRQQPFPLLLRGPYREQTIRSYDNCVGKNIISYSLARLLLEIRLPSLSASISGCEGDCFLYLADLMAVSRCWLDLRQEEIKQTLLMQGINGLLTTNRRFVSKRRVFRQLYIIKTETLLTLSKWTEQHKQEEPEKKSTD